jgi:hypothetical protein
MTILLLCVFLWSAFSGTEAKANTQTAASCNPSDVQTAINAASEGDTVLIPACPAGVSWTSGVTISGKGIIVQGAGPGRIIAYDNGTEVLTVGTGTLTVNIAGYSPGFSASSITTGETLRVFENNARANYMQGTVTSLSGSTLTMNITSTGGSGSTHRWLIATVPSTVLINNYSISSEGSGLFNVTEDTSFHTNISGIKIAQGTGSISSGVVFNYASGGQAILLHDCWIESSTNDGFSVYSTTNRGVIWNCSFDSSPWAAANEAVSFRLAQSSTSSWTTPATWGAADTTGQGNMYVETNDFHAFLDTADFDDSARGVWRYNLMDNSGVSTHGPDSSLVGMRYFEFYNNIGVFNGYGDGTTFALDWWIYWRGGTGVVFNNTLAAISSQDYTSPDVVLIVQNLQRNSGPDPCWGANPPSAGYYYPSPRQLGMGYVTGKGTANYPHDGVTNSPTDSITYVGDSEPIYVWGNNRLPLNVVTRDFGSGNSTSCSGATYDSTANYVVLNRDYFNGSTAKPGYTPYTYPHPLAQCGSTATATGSTPAAPTCLQATVVAQ